MALPATDNLQGTANTDLAPARWTPVCGGASAFVYNGDGLSVRAFNAGEFSISYWDDDVFGDDQYSQVVITDDGAGGVMGPAVRIAAGADCYVARADGNLARYDDATGLSGETILASGLTSAVDGDTLRIEASGSTIARLINGATQGSVTDATYASGSAGLYGYSQSDQKYNDWEGGNIGVAPTVVSRGLVNAGLVNRGLLNAGLVS